MSQEQKQEFETTESAATTDEEQSSEDSFNLDQLIEENSRLQQELQETQSRLLRVTADFDNFRRRSRQEKEELGQYATMKMLQELLPVIDNFQLALAAETTDAQALKQGVEMVFRQLQSILEREGLTPMQAVGQPFDPAFHEAVLQVESDQHESGIVMEELRTGYLLHDKVLRPAMVKVSQ